MNQMTTQPHFPSLRRLLLASDLGPRAADFLMQATTLCKREKLDLTLFHAVPPIPKALSAILFPYAALGADENILWSEILAYAENQLQHLSHQTLPKDFASDADEHTQPTAPRCVVKEHPEGIVPAILAASQAQEVDLLLCGAAGQRPPHPSRLGSVAAELIRPPRYPTWLMRGLNTPTAPQKILVALDATETTPQLLRFAIAFALLWPDVDLELVTVIPDAKALDPAGLLDSSRTPADTMRNAQSKAKQRIEHILGDIIVPFSVEDRVRRFSFNFHCPLGDPALAILELAHQKDHTAIIVGSQHPKNKHLAALGRCAAHICTRANADVVVVPIAQLLVDTQDA